MKGPSIRPVIRIKKDRLDYLFLTGSYAIMASMWIYVLRHYESLPENIPVHFGANGMPDGFGHKSTLFLIPIIVSLIFILLEVLCRFPHKFNYLVEITTDNAEWQYRKALRLMRYIQLFIPAIFCYIIFKEIEGATAKKSSLDFWFIPTLIFGIMIPTVYTIYKSLVKK